MSINTSSINASCGSVAAFIRGAGDAAADTDGHVGNAANYLATQLLQDLAGISSQAIDSAPYLKRKLLEIQCDQRLGKLRLFERDGRIAFSIVPYD